MKGRRPRRLHCSLVDAAKVCAFAAGTEYVQARLLPYRTGDLADFKADLLALALSSVIVLILDISKQKKA